MPETTILPPDDTGYGFDTNGDALCFYLSALWKSTFRSGFGSSLRACVYTVPQNRNGKLPAIAGGVEYGDSRVMAHNGMFSTTCRLPRRASIPF